MSVQTSDQSLKQAQMPIMGASGPNHASGAVPDPGPTPGSPLRFLREDTAWEVPPENSLTGAGTGYLGAGGVLSGYGPISLTTTVVDADMCPIINYSILVHGNITTLNGGGLGPVTFDNISSGTVTVNGGLDGGDSYLTEGPSLVSSGSVNGGYCDTSATQDGGDALVYLDGTKTSWAAINLTSGGSDYYALYNGGSAYLILNSILTSATLDVTCNLVPGGTSGPNGPGGCQVVLNGASLADISLNVVINDSSWSGFYPWPLAIDFTLSGSIANDASQDALVNDLLSQPNPIWPYFLDMGGTCATPSSATLDDINSLIAMGWTVTHN